MLFVTPNSNLCIYYHNHNGDKQYKWITVFHFVYSYSIWQSSFSVPVNVHAYSGDVGRVT